MKQLASRMQQSAPHYFAKLGRRLEEMKKRGIDVIRLDMGSPDLPPHPAVVRALAEAAAEDNTHGYQAQQGPQSLRQAWVEMYRRNHGVSLDPQEEVQPLMGSKEGIFHLTQAFVENGDAVLVPDPGYVTYRDAAQFAGGEVYYMKLEPHLGYLPDLGALPLELVRRAKLMWLNYPNNPTAAVAPLEFLAESVAFARRNDLLLCHDAAYSQVTFDGYHAPSVLEVPGAKEVAVEFNSLSKSHNMAGWRMGVLVGNAQAVHALFALLTNVDSGHFLPMHVAAAKAMSLDQAWIDQRNKVYQERRNLVVGALQKTGLEVEAPKASLYVWFPVTPGQTSMEFVERALEEAHVSLTSGTLFGPGGEGFVRISITEPLEVLSEAMQRLNAMLDREG